MSKEENKTHSPNSCKVIIIIHIEALDERIWIRGRKENGEIYEEIIKDFKPYFYIPTDKPTELKSISGENVERVDCIHPGEVPVKRLQYSKTFESDIPYVIRYLCDRVGDIPKEPLRVAYIDIETQTNNGKFPDVGKALCSIYSIALYDNFLKKYLIFAWKEGLTESKEVIGEKVFFFFENELKMLLKFISYIKQNEPDILTAWFGDSFDFPYIFNRLTKLGMSPTILSPLGEMEEFRDRVRLRGRETFDLYYGYMKLSKGEKESRSLNYIGSQELGLEKVKYEGTLDELREKDFTKFLEYNLRDVEIMVKLDEKLGIIDFHDSLRRLAKTTWWTGFTTNKMVDAYCLNYCKGKFVLPKTISGKKDKSYKGGLVFDPKKGLNKFVIASDMRSLYPSLIISHNMSPETLSNEGDITTVTGVKFKSEPKGMIPGVLEKLLLERKEVRRKMKQFEFGTQEYERYDKEQYALKELMNSFYGAMGNPGFRIYKYEIAETITAMAREVLKHIKSTLENQGFEIIAGDTDSTYFVPRSSNQYGVSGITDLVKTGIETIGVVNKSFDEFSKMWNLKTHILNLQFERIFKTLIFTQRDDEKAAKKRYAGVVCYEDGKEVDYVKIVGFEAKRSDTPYISRRFQKDFLTMLLREESKEKIIEFVKKFYNDIVEKKYPPEDIALPKGLSKDPYEYGKVKENGKRNTLPIHARAALYSNKFNNTDIRMKDKVKMLYVRGVPPNQPFTNVIAITDFLPQGYVVDYETMAEKICIDKVKRFFEIMGWNIAEIFGQKGLGEWM